MYGNKYCFVILPERYNAIATTGLNAAPDKDFPNNTAMAVAAPIAK
jgi:hypothetical protein